MSYRDFSERMASINDLLNAVSVLQWDSRTMMPPGGVESRAKQLATLTLAARDMLLADDTRRLTDAASREVGGLAEDAPERRAVAQAAHAIAFHSRIPADLIRRKTELKTVANAAWIEARARSDFSLFRPHLARMIDATRAYADAIGYERHPYDALVSLYEPGETVDSLDRLFSQLRAGLAPILAAVRAAEPPRADFLERHFPPDRQREVASRLAAGIGFDFGRGRLDSTVHPFEVSFTRHDVRITTRFNPQFLSASLFGTLHEAGHGIYEQGVDPAYTRSPLTTDLVLSYAVGGTSFGAHESQARLYENAVGRSRPFWRAHFAQVQAAFPDALADVDADAFWRAVNRVRPGFIRVEADQLTYDFHIMLRVDLEKALMDGSLTVDELPEAWNAAMARELGLTVPDDARGVLQDIHWSTGMIGSFCTYTIGNVLAGQLMEAALATEAVSAGFDAGDCTALTAWLGEAVHRHGRRYGRDELLERATGRALDAAPYVAALRTRLSEVYGITTPHGAA